MSVTDAAPNLDASSPQRPTPAPISRHLFPSHHPGLAASSSPSMIAARHTFAPTPTPRAISLTTTSRPPSNENERSRAPPSCAAARHAAAHDSNASRIATRRSSSSPSGMSRAAASHTSAASPSLASSAYVRSAATFSASCRAARVLRPGGILAFLTVSSQSPTCSPATRAAYQSPSSATASFSSPILVACVCPSWFPGCHMKAKSATVTA